MLDLWKRWVQFHELYLQSEPEDAPLIEFKTLVPLWVRRIKAGNAVKLIRNETAAIRIADCRHDKVNNVLILLVHYSDTNVTDPVFSNLATGKLRKESKLAGEGVAVSAHVAISILPYDANKMLYKLILEEIPGLGRSTLSPFIKSELKDIAEGMFEYKDRDDNNKTKNYLPAAEILGTPSKPFENEVGEGVVLQSIELVKLTRKAAEFDEEGFYTEASRHIKLVPDQNNLAAAWETVKHALSKAKEKGYDNVKFRYKHPKGKVKTATMGTTIGDIEDALVTKTESIEAKEVLSQCSDKIVVSIADKMTNLLKA